MSQTKSPRLREVMPSTAKWVDDRRAEHGAALVIGQIRLARSGTAGHFFAMEGGHVLGTPFPTDHPIYPDQKFAVMIGSSFAAFMATPVTTAGA
jgi:hypothetical protein